MIGPGDQSAPRPLVGRERELGGLDRFLSAACEGPAGCLVEGEPGIGKTALWDWGVQVAREKFYRVLTFRAVAAEATFGYCGLADLIEPVLDQVAGGLSMADRRAIEVSLLRVNEAPERIEPRAVALAGLHVLRALATTGPMLVAIDDAQWLDDASARALAFAIRRLEREPVGILITRRSGAHEATLELEQLMPEARVVRHRVGPLSVNDLVEILRRQAAVTLSRGSLARCARQAAGNPFYALELARSTERAGASADESPVTPPDLRSLVAERVGELPAATRRALLFASALWVPTVSAIAAALGRADGQVPSLRRAQEAKVIEVQANVVRFTHPLLASEVYSATSPRERRRCHQTLARVVQDPEEAAEHEARGADGPDERIADRLEHAAQRADARGAPETAAELCARAAALTPPELTDKLWARQVAAAEYHAAAGDTNRARLLLQDTIATAQPGRVRAWALTSLAEIVFNDTYFRDSKGFLEQALTEVGDDLVLRARILFNLSNWYANDNQRVRSGEVVRDIVALVDESGDAGLRARSLSALLRFKFMAGTGFDRALFDRAIAAVSAVTPPRATVSTRLNLGVTLLQVGDLQGAREQLDAVYSMLVMHGDETRLPLVLTLKAWLEEVSGNWRRGLEFCDASAEAAVRAEQEVVRSRAMRQKAVLLAYLGLVEQARAISEAAPSNPAVAGTVGEVSNRSMHGFIALSLQDFAAALAEFDGLRELTAATEVFDPVYYQWLPDEIEALVRLGRLADAREPLEWLEERGRTLERPWAIATSSRCRALLEHAEGQVAAALTSVKRALEAHERLPMPFELARTLLVKGTVERRARSKGPARSALQKALAMFEELGASLWADWTRDELAHIGGRSSSPDRLTPTERRVADLVGSGRSNEEVARLLFMSAKTIEWNLTKVYRKLHVRSRAELAAKLSKLRH
jgi:DNA-binding CsgD family transcriptional regulator